MLDKLLLGRCGYNRYFGMYNQSQKLLLYQNSVFNKDLSMSEFIVPASANVYLCHSALCRVCQGQGVKSCYSQQILDSAGLPQKI